MTLKDFYLVSDIWLDVLIWNTANKTIFAGHIGNLKYIQMDYEIVEIAMGANNANLFIRVKEK